MNKSFAYNLYEKFVYVMFHQLYVMNLDWIQIALINLCIQLFVTLLFKFCNTIHSIYCVCVIMFHNGLIQTKWSFYWPLFQMPIFLTRAEVTNWCFNRIRCHISAQLFILFMFEHSYTLLKAVNKFLFLFNCG